MPTIDTSAIEGYETMTPDQKIEALTKFEYQDYAFELAKTILAENIDKLHFIADFLVKHEVMDGEQFAALMDRGAGEQELLAIAEERARKSREANEQREQEEQERARREAEQKEAQKAEENPFPYAQPAPEEEKNDRDQDQDKNDKNDKDDKDRGNFFSL